MIIRRAGVTKGNLASHQCLDAVSSPSFKMYSSVILDDCQKGSGHAGALQVVPESLSRYGVICLFEVDECSMQPAGLPWL
eukprot:1158866-Pelagomonas_calceolata.AAC.10